MPRLRSAVRIALLALLAVAALNGFMVFLFFDGTNFYGHLYALQARAEAELDAGRIGRLERQIAATRAEGNLARLRMEESLRREYAHLDSVLRNADILIRNPIPKRDLEARFRADHPFRIQNGKLMIYLGGDRIYEETFPRYARLGFPTPGSSPIARASESAFGGQSPGNRDFAFVLARRTAPIELWEAYRRIDDTSYQYYSEYLLDMKNGRLMKRGTDPDMGSAP